MSSTAAASPATSLEPVCTTFHPFPRLPKELYLDTWGKVSRDNYPSRLFTYCGKRPTSNPPSVLHACKEAREEGLKTFKLFSSISSPAYRPQKNSPYYIDPAKDVFCYLDPMSTLYQPVARILLESYNEAKVQQLVINENILRLYISLVVLKPSENWVNIDALGALFQTGNIKTLILVRDSDTPGLIRNEEVTLVTGADWVTVLQHDMRPGSSVAKRQKSFRRTYTYKSYDR
jgi:hypothetical protein